jgi:hypothetical protein
LLEAGGSGATACGAGAGAAGEAREAAAVSVLCAPTTADGAGADAVEEDGNDSGADMTGGLAGGDATGGPVLGTEAAASWESAGGRAASDAGVTGARGWLAPGMISVRPTWTW